jgi:hypothetical protein
MDAWRPVLGAPDGDRRRLEVYVVDPHIDQLAYPQRMAEGHQHQQPIALRVAALASCSEQLLDLGLGQVFPRPILAILAATTGCCRLFSR